MSTPEHSTHLSRPTRALRASRLGRWYRGLSRRGQTTVEALVALPGPLVVGFLIYAPLAFTAPVVLEVVFWVVFVSMAVTSFLIAMECARAYRFPEPPLSRQVPDRELPRIATIVAAYLPNEQDTLMESLQAHLALDYPADRHLLVLAYNTPEPLPIESRLEALAEHDPRVIVLRVEGSTSKVENVNAALTVLGDGVDVIGIFDADHHPHPTAPRRVAQWLGDAAGDQRFDVVQGQCAVRNVEESRVTRTVAAEFATLYAVAHPGRTVVHDFGIFGGSNGWWRAPVITELGLNATMLTEDIDVSARALADGRRLATDPRILSYELAPVTWSAWWRQRMRWSQGWLEVSLRHASALVRNPRLSLAQRRGVVMLFGWRIVHPWIATQMAPVLLAMSLVPGRDIPWLLLFFVFSAAGINGIPVLQAVAANRLGPPGVGGRPWLFTRFTLVSLVFYAELRMMVTRGSVVRHVLGAHTWDVTSRSAKQATSAALTPEPVVSGVGS
ncbi:glycosyltransferase [Nocardioides rubriscoriae]|uniref:glycosyltransferase n=1 Tax=Nocardioides rubriscoriae TaxID=642762 RepID=UPI0011DF1DC1|nr:glycosyltransferase family 2 protein [Nocardioides rubriscoriae]